jgi:predicted permease
MHRLLRKHREQDLERELRSHLEQETQEQHEHGLSSQDARYAAQRALGNTAFIKEEVREMWGWTTVGQIMQDVRYAVRGMRKNPGFTMVATLSLALGIGATTAVFSVMNAFLLRPLPVDKPDRLVVVQSQLRGKRFPLFNPLFENLRDSQLSLKGMVAISDEPYLKVAFNRATPGFVRGSFVSGDYFQMLGLSPAIGRLLTRDDDDPSAVDCAAVISHAYWTNHFHRDAAVLGTQIRVREKDCIIVGVAPAGFSSHQPGYSADLWLPLRPLTDPKLLASHGMGFFSGVMGRLWPDVTRGQAQTELTALYQRIEATEPAVSPRPGEAPPKPNDFSIVIAPGAQGLDALRRQFGQALALVLAVVGVILLIAAVNVSNLLLARGAARNAEIATRVALGAGRLRLMRQLGIEGAMLAGCGGVVGVTLALLGTPALAKLMSLRFMPVVLDTSPDYRVIGVALAATIFAALVASLPAALRLSSAGLQIGMASFGRATGTRSGQRLARTLVAAQLALSLLLVTSSGLLLRTMLRVMAVDPGFDTSHVVLMDVRDTEPAAGFGQADTPEVQARRAAQYRELDQRLNGIPGVRAASISWLGLFGGNYVGLNLHDADHPDDRHFTLLDYISPRYFETIGMQTLRGRVFTEADRDGSIPVAVVNEAFVRERMHGREAIGHKFVMTYANDTRPFSIVGIIRNSKYNDLREAKTEPMMWVPLAQAPFKISSVSLRVQPGAESAVIRQAEDSLTATNPNLMLRKVTTLRTQVDQATSRERLLLTLASGFGGLALLLAAVGLYGTLAYAVARRTREIGVRLALGAQRDAVVRLVLGESLMLVAGGMLAGVPLSLAAGYSLRAFLFGVTAHDIPAFVGACAVLTVVAVLAAFVPARRASRVDPMTSLRCE